MTDLLTGTENENSTLHVPAAHLSVYSLITICLLTFCFGLENSFIDMHATL